MFNKNRSYVEKTASWYIMMSLIMFGFIFDFYFEAFGIPTFVTSSRLSAIAIVVIAIAKGVKKNNSCKIYFNSPPNRLLIQILKFHVPILIYMFVLYISIGVVGDDRHMFVILVQVFIFRIIPIYAFFVCFNKLEELMVILIWVVIAQTVIVWLCISNPSFKFTIDYLFNINDVFIDKAEIYAGGLGCITSKGLLRYALGEVACVYMYYNRNKVFYIVLLLVFSLTGVLIARTGLLFSAICFIFVLVFTMKRKKGSAYFTLALSFIIAVMATNMILSSKTTVDLLEERLLRTIELFEQSQAAKGIFDIGYFDDYLHGDRVVIPPISIETIFGTGVPSGKSGNGIYVNVDGGFLRLYVAYGLVLAFIFYLFFFTRLQKILRLFKKIEVRYTILLMIILIFLGEIKEWNIYNSCHVTIFFLMAFLAYRDLINQTLNCKIIK